MNDELTRRLIDTVDGVGDKVDDVRERVARVEEKQRAMRDAQEQRHGDNRLGMHNLIREVGELRKETEAGRFEMSTAYQALKARVDVIEAAEKRIEEQVASAAFRGGGIGGLIATAVSSAVAFWGWLSGWVHFSPPKL